MFCPCANAFGAEPNTNTCAGVPRASGHAPGAQPRGDRAHHQDRPRPRQRDRPAFALPPEELLLPGHAEELPDQPVRPADLRRRAPRRRAGGRHGLARRHHPGAHGGRHRQDPARQRVGAHPRRDPRLDRLQSRGRSPRRVRERAGHALPGGGRRVPPRAARDPRVARCLGREDGGGVASLRRERLAATGRHRGVRHEGRDQEHELDPLARARADLRDRTAAARAGCRRADRAGDAALGRGRRGDEVDALQGRGVRLSLLPRARHPGARARPGLDRGDPCVAARAAAGAARAIRRRARPEAGGRPGADRRPRVHRAVRRRARRRRRSGARRELGDPGRGGAPQRGRRGRRPHPRAYRRRRPS